MKVTNIASMLDNKIPVNFSRMLPLTSLGDARKAPKVIGMKYSKRSNLKPIAIGVINAKQTITGPEKSVSLTNSMS